jgi:hypothetical protein
MDLAPFDGKADDGAEMVVMHPGTGDATDAVITLAGMDSRAWRAASHKLRSNVFSDGADQDRVVKAFEMSEQHVAELLASVTLSWKNVKDGGPDLECTRENAKKLYVKYPWLREQVNRFAGNRANFFRSIKAAAPSGDEGAGSAAAASER